MQAGPLTCDSLARRDAKLIHLDGRHPEASKDQQGQMFCLCDAIFMGMMGTGHDDDDDDAAALGGSGPLCKG